MHGYPEWTITATSVQNNMDKSNRRPRKMGGNNKKKNRDIVVLLSVKGLMEKVTKGLQEEMN